MPSVNPYVTPRGFRQSPASGLIVPEAQSRERQVWTNDEARLLDRAFRLLTARGVQFALGCATCQGSEKALKMTKNVAGERIARCGHLDRILSRFV